MHYFVFSYGGTGSTMLAKFLSKYGSSYHLHDDSPPQFLTSKTTGTAHDQTNVKDVLLSRDQKYFLSPKKCRVIYIYRSPVIAKISRPSTAHFSHMNSTPEALDEYRRIMNNSPYFKNVCGEFSKKDAMIQTYAEHGVDLNGYEKHFDNWTKVPWDRGYDILLLNYSSLWDSLGTLFDFCEIPPSHISRFPAKKETWKKKNISEDTMQKMRVIYTSLQEKIDIHPPTKILKSNKEA